MKLTCFWTTSIRTRLILGVALLHAVLIGIFVMDLVQDQRRFLHQEQLETVQSLSKGIALAGNSAVLAGDLVGVQEVLSAVSGARELQYGFVVDADGKVLAHTNRSLVGQFVSDPLSLTLQGASPEARILVDSADLIDVAAPVVEKSRVVAWVRLGVGQQRLHQAVQHVVYEGLVFVLIAVSIGGAFAAWLGRRLTQSLYGLLEVANATYGGKRDLRAPVTAADEVGQLATAFNRMLDRLSESENGLKSLNEELEQRVEQRTADLKALNEELEGFTFATSHDLKGPLGRINSFSTLLDMKYRDRLDEDGLLYLKFIRENASRLMHLIEDLLRHARIARQTPVLEDMDVQAAILAVMQERSEDLKERRADVRLDIRECTVTADPYAFHQVLNNLVENALKYSPDANPPILEIGLIEQDGICRLWVKDNGIGFEMKYHEKIFEMFGRLHAYNKIPGTGIGLALVKRAMERMGGKVWAESVPEQGTTFFLELRLAG